MMTDEEILHGVSQGNQQALEVLLAEYAGFLHSFLEHLTKDRELAEELVQDIFLKVWEARDTLMQIRDFKSYLFIISRNHALKVVDKMLTERKRHAEWKKQHFDTHDELISEDRLSLVDEAISKLPPQQLKVWTMSRREGKQYSEIAAELKLSKETVKYYLKLATASITEHISRHIEMVLILFFLKK